MSRGVDVVPRKAQRTLQYRAFTRGQRGGIDRSSSRSRTELSGSPSIVSCGPAGDILTAMQSRDAIQKRRMSQTSYPFLAEMKGGPNGISKGIQNVGRAHN